MKKILLLVTLIISLNSYSQVYVKAAPTLFMPKHTSSKVGVLGAVGKQLTRYTKAGIGGGYFKLNGYDKGFGLVGVDLNVTDFNKRKLLPFIHTSAYYPIYRDTETHGTVDYVSTGKFQIQFSGGVSFPILKESHLFISGGVSDLLYTTTVESPISKSQDRIVLHMWILSAGILL